MYSAVPTLLVFEVIDWLIDWPYHIIPFMIPPIYTALYYKWCTLVFSILFSSWCPPVTLRCTLIVYNSDSHTFPFWYPLGFLVDSQRPLLLHTHMSSFLFFFYWCLMYLGGVLWCWVRHCVYCIGLQASTLLTSTLDYTKQSCAIVYNSYISFMVSLFYSLLKIAYLFLYRSVYGVHFLYCS